MNSVVLFLFMKFQLQTFFFFVKFFACNCYCIEGVKYVRTGCLSLSGFVETSEAVFEAERSLAKKAKQKRKRLQNVYIFVGLSAGNQNVRERERVCVVSGSHNGELSEFDKTGCRQIKTFNISFRSIVSRSTFITRGQILLSFIQKWQFRL